jgi:putative FmdB family regulatory protein
MPVYCYKCEDCQQEFEVRHSMFYGSQVCVNCASTKIFKIPSFGNPVKKELMKGSKPGKVVKDYISNAKKEIKIEKDKMKSREI